MCNKKETLHSVYDRLIKEFYEDNSRMEYRLILHDREDKEAVCKLLSKYYYLKKNLWTILMEASYDGGMNIRGLTGAILLLRKFGQFVDYDDYMNHLEQLMKDKWRILDE